MKTFWKEFFSGDNSKVNTMAVLGFVISTPFAAVAFVALIYHIFIINKPMDGQTVTLLLGILGISCGGAGASLFSRTSWSQTTWQGMQNLGHKMPRPKKNEEV